MKCGDCGHEKGFKRNKVSLDKGLCRCRCHLVEVRKPVPKKPNKVEIPKTAYNRKVLKKWLKDYLSDRFNN
jgi:hypothetical protein